MIGKPYRFVTRIDQNNYYVLDALEHPYVAIESVLDVQKGKRTVQLQQGFKLLPLPTPMMMFLVSIQNLRNQSTDKLHPDYVEFDYNIYFELVNKMKDLSNTNNITDELPFELFEKYEQTQTNNTILSLEHSGFTRLYSTGAIGLPTHGRSTWLAKVNRLGGVTLMEVITVGKNDPYNNTVLINTTMLNIPLVNKIIKKLEHKDKKTQTKEETVN